MPNKKPYLEDAILMAAGGLPYLIYRTVASAVSKSSLDTTEESIEELRGDAERQRLMMEMAQAQARVAQELAIAHRIERATEVQIEEYYEYSGKGEVGLKSDGKSALIGASGSGQRVSKRIYKFIGGETREEHTQAIPKTISANVIPKKTSPKRKNVIKKS